MSQLLRTPPRLSYCGLTIVLSNPSRFDVSSKKLCSAGAENLINDWCLRPEFNIMQCDIRVMEDNSQWIKGTKCILLLGEAAMHKYLPETRENVLNEMRGSPFLIGDIPTLCSFFPQDACDARNHEQRLNNESKEFLGSETSDAKDEEEGDVKRFANTSRKNYPFWLRADIRKCKEVIKNGGCYPKSKFAPAIYHNYPSCDTVVQALESTSGAWMDFDTETDYEEQNLLCFSFCFDGTNVYNVPVLDHNYKWAYSGLPYIMRALVIALEQNTVVAHNGAGFDFPLLGYKYRIPVYKCWDTMIALHRCFPDIEKSLGHGVSYWLWEKFHKDSNPTAYRTQDDMMQKIRYCGKDVYTMSCMRKEIQNYANTIPGLAHSISVAMASIRPYTITSLLGIPYSEKKRQAIIKENDALMGQYLRIINHLIGPEGMKEVLTSVKSKKPGAFPSSNTQCCKYFHDMLGYPVVARGKPNKTTGVRAPSLAKKAMYKLRMRFDNPVIDFVNLYRAVKLQTTTPLGFMPYKDDENKVIPKSKDQSSPEIPGLL